MSLKRFCTASSRTDRPRVLVVVGPTGVGKTAILAKLFAGAAEVVSADAFQVYRGLDIGTAKPSPEVLSRLPHHLINIVDYRHSFNVGEFLHRAENCVADIVRRERVPVISGGSAFYIRAWLMGLPATPPSDRATREALARRWADDEALRSELKRLDPLSAERIGKKDRYRMLRALEVISQTGRPLSDFPSPNQIRRDSEILCIGLRRNRVDLYKRIEERVEEMMRAGLEEEVAALRGEGACAHHPGMKAIGYREWFGTDGDTQPAAPEVGELIKRDTRRLAKRQMTFFSAFPGVKWFDAEDNPDSPGGLSDTVRDFLAHGAESPPVS